jgi:acid phosphatase
MTINALLPRWRLTAALSLILALGAIAPLRAQVPVPDGSVRFLAFGDWGRDGQDFQLPVAEQMGLVAAADHSQFIVALGDNFYNDGVTSVEARQWTTSFEEVYTAPSLQIPWYVALGNHDYHTNVEAEVDYTLFSPRWKMPTRYYTVTRRIDAANTVQFFIIDSTPFVAQSGVQAARHSDAAQQDTAAQTAWLEAELKKSTAQWKIVCAHHPIYSSGKHGDTAALVEHIEPLLEKYGVQVYLNGHEHDLEHLRVGQINYFTSGAGSKTRPATHDARTLFSLGDTGGFLAVKITPDTFEGRFIDYTGKEVYATRFSRAAAIAPAAAAP